MVQEIPALMPETLDNGFVDLVVENVKIETIETEATPQFTTWITEKDGHVDRIRQVPGDKSPGPEWRLVPNDWGGSPGDDISWYDADGRRIPDPELIKKGKRKDNKGRWYSKNNIGETKQIYGLDEEPGEDWTREKPLKDEPFQKWDSKKKKFVVDEEKKEKADKETRISEKKDTILSAEQRIQRSLIAKMNGTATKEDEQYFAKISSEIETLRDELLVIQE